jgi:hypothetical protein
MRKTVGDPSDQRRSRALFDRQDNAFGGDHGRWLATANCKHRKPGTAASDIRDRDNPFTRSVEMYC